MWLDTLLVRNAATSKPSVASEDDTFEALIRIPLKAMDERLGEFESSIVRERLYNWDWIRKANKCEDRKQALLRPLSWLGFKKDVIFFYHTQPILGGIDPAVFEGTGWTPQDYIDEVQEEVNARIAAKKAAELLKFKKVLLGILIIANITPWVIFVFGPFHILITLAISIFFGVAGGMVLARLIK